MENQTQSPRPNKSKQGVMTFPEAMKWVVLGSKITKLEWYDQRFYWILKDGYLKLHKDDDKFYDWILSEGDLIGEDYVILQDMNWVWKARSLWKTVDYE